VVWTRFEAVSRESQAYLKLIKKLQNVVENLLASFGLLCVLPLGKGEKMNSRGF
jgi:hypothetical protein